MERGVFNQAFVPLYFSMPSDEISETHGIAAWPFLGSEASSPCLFADTDLQWGTVTAMTFSFSNMVTALCYFLIVCLLGLSFGSQVKFYCFCPLTISQS